MKNENLISSVLNSKSWSFLSQTMNDEYLSRYNKREVMYLLVIRLPTHTRHSFGQRITLTQICFWMIRLHLRCLKADKELNFYNKCRRYSKIIKSFSNFVKLQTYTPAADIDGKTALTFTIIIWVCGKYIVWQSLTKFDKVDMFSKEVIKKQSWQSWCIFIFIFKYIMQAKLAKFRYESFILGKVGKVQIKSFS